MTIGSEEFERILRSRGMRVTSQRHHIFEAVNRLKHATPEAILDEVAAQLPGMTLSTVYRALEALEEADLVTHTHLGHSPLTYHAVDDHQHIHLVCETCQQVISADSSLADALRHQIAQAYEFDVDPTHMAMAGRCKNCRVVAP
jgi:Fur family ferric uptake transcriptional regulator